MAPPTQESIVIPGATRGHDGHRGLSFSIALVVALTASIIALSSPGDTAPAQLVGPYEIDVRHADLIGLSADDQGVRLDGTLRDVAAYAPFERAGIGTTSPFDARSAVSTAITRVTGDVPDGTAIDVEVRGSSNGVDWTSWQTPSADSSVLFPWPVRFIQHRLTLLGDETSPVLTALEVAVQPAAPQVQALQAKTNPTVKIFASREGLIGRTTANGHTIAAGDRFVALPSKKVLNPRGKEDYRVRVSYQGRTVEAPVWDVGPWNTKDNYWDGNREMFPELSRFMPQAFAAWADNHNGGRDQSGRWVSFPAALDISDALFVDELKMRTSSWVDVTFLWVDAASPPTGPTPPVTGLKPQDSKGMQASRPQPDPTRVPTTSPATPEPTAAPTNTPTRTESQATAEPTRVPSTSTPARPTATPEPTASAAISAADEPSEGQGVASAPPEVAAQPQVVAAMDAPRAYASHIAHVRVGEAFQSRIALFNPTDEGDLVTLQFIRPDGQRELRQLIVPEQSRATFALDELPSGEYSAQIESDRPLLAERTILFGDDGLTQAAVAEPARQWYFPDGSTETPSETLITLRNLGPGEARTTLTFITELGRLATGEVRLARGARTVVNLAELLPALPVSTIVESDQPILAERLTFRNGRIGGDGGAGATAASVTWYFADANTADGVDPWLILLNPGANDAAVIARLFDERGPAGERHYWVPAGTRRPIHLKEDLAGGRFALLLSADEPIVAERTEFVGPGPKADGMSSMIGATAPGTAWAFPEGHAGQETIAIFNPGEHAGALKVELFGERGKLSTRDFQVGAERRAAIDISGEPRGSVVSVRITSDRPIVAEREIQLSDGRGETAALGIRLP